MENTQKNTYHATIKLKKVTVANILSDKVDLKTRNDIKIDKEFYINKLISLSNMHNNLFPGFKQIFLTLYAFYCHKLYSQFF